jgi:hypothetical protein
MPFNIPSPEKIRAMTSQQRAVLYQNAKTRLAEGGQAVWI